MKEAVREGPCCLNGSHSSLDSKMLESSWVCTGHGLGLGTDWESRPTLNEEPTPRCSLQPSLPTPTWPSPTSVRVLGLESKVEGG